jgi:hypothetical protein
MTIVACPAASLGSAVRMSEEEKTEHEQKLEEAKQEIHRLEDDPPEKLEDWPDGQAKYETFGGAEGDHSYDEGPEAKLGPDSVRHHEDGSVEVGGERSTTPASSRATRSPAARPTRTRPATRTSSGSPRTTRTAKASLASRPRARAPAGPRPQARAPARPRPGPRSRPPRRAGSPARPSGRPRRLARPGPTRPPRRARPRPA